MSHPHNKRKISVSRQLSLLAGAVAISLFGGSGFAAPILAADQSKLPSDGRITGDLSLNISATEYVTARNLVIAPGAKLTLNGFGLMQLNSITIETDPITGAAGYLDIDQCGLQIAGMSETAVRSLVKLALNSKPESKGLYSRETATMPGTTVAVVNNRAGSGLVGVDLPMLPTFHGVDAHASDILVGFTWIGDVNMDGAVTTADLATIASNIGIGSTWSTGDVNYDDKVDAVEGDLNTDLAIADSVVNRVPIILNPTGGGVQSFRGDEIIIPEPTGLLTILVGMAPAIRRRDRRTEM
jgi:hypothetical protein